MMIKRARIQSFILYSVFTIYILFLMKLLLLSRVSLGELFRGEGSLSRSFNLFPFRSIIEFVFGDEADARKFAFSNLVGNIVIFIPLGVYLSLLKKDKRAMTIVVFIFLVSLFVEVVQGIFGIGTADVDDLILNCVGGWMGVLAYKFLLLILREEKKAATAIAILSVAGLPVLFLLLFMVKLRL